MVEWNLLLQAASTLAMVGLIWFVQIVHYPLFGRVGREMFAVYEREHQHRTTLVVAPLMLVEVWTTLSLVWRPPAAVPIWMPVSGALLLAIIWASTWCWQVPAHAKLEASFDAATHRRLVRSNWLRTVAWTARGLLVCGMLGEMLAERQ